MSEIVFGKNTCLLKPSLNLSMIFNRLKKKDSGGSQFGFIVDMYVTCNFLPVESIDSSNMKAIAFHVHHHHHHISL